jgi:hypothetical protein
LILVTKSKFSGSCRPDRQLEDTGVAEEKIDATEAANGFVDQVFEAGQSDTLS